MSSNPEEPSDPIRSCVSGTCNQSLSEVKRLHTADFQDLHVCVHVCMRAQRINATGPGPKVPSNPAGPKDPKTWGWYRHSESSFGYVRLVTKTGEDGDASMRVEFVRSYAVEHEPVVDENGRSLHVPLVSAPLPYVCRWSVHFLSTCAAGHNLLAC